MPTTEIVAETLVKMRARSGAAVPLEEFWPILERHRADLMNQAYVILSNQADAEDVVQETFSQAFVNLSQLRDPAKLNQWLRGINRNLAMNLLQRQTRAKEERLATGQAGALEAPRPTTMATGPISRTDVVVHAVDALPEPFREVLVLRYWEKLSNEEIARRLNIAAGTVWSRTARANRMLAAKLKNILRQERPA